LTVLKGIMAAYAWSLITDRSFLINISRPCDLNKFLEPNLINWHQSNISNRFIHRIKAVDNHKYRASIEKLTLNEFDSNYQYIVIRNNLDWLEPMSKNKNISQKLITLGYDPSNISLPK